MVDKTGAPGLIEVLAISIKQKQVKVKGVQNVGNKKRNKTN